MRFPFLQPSAATGQVRRSACALSAAAIVAGSLAWYGPAHVRAQAPRSWGLATQSVPSNVRLSPGPVTNDGMVVITWDASSGSNVGYYQIFRVNGAALAAASEVTYIGRTEDARNYFIDQTPTEGFYQYAVIAVDDASNASQPSAWAKVTADFPSNGIGKIEPDVTAPAAPGSLHAGVLSADGKSVALGWNKSDSGDLWRYIVYRQENNGTPKPAGYTGGATNTFTDTVPADGNYGYYVVAQDKTGNVSAPTATAGVSVDSTAPGVDISAPVAGVTTFTDQVPADVETTAPNVAAAMNPGNGGDTTAGNQILIDLLISLRGDISEEQFNRLLAELRAGRTETFIVLIVEYRGKSITVTSADKLLKAVGYKWQWHDRDDDDGERDDDNHHDNGNHYGWDKGKGHDKDDDKRKHGKGEHGSGHDKGHGDHEANHDDD